MIGEGQFSRPIALASDPTAPLPRLAWRPGAACPGEVGGCPSFCQLAPASCPDTACLPVLIDSGTPLSVLPSGGAEVSFGQECLELRSAGGLLEAPDDPDVLAAASAAFRFRESPVVRAPGDSIEGWAWEVGDDRHVATVGGVVGGNILRDFAMQMRHLEGEPPSLSVFSSYPGSEEVLADQGRAYIRLQYPGRLLGRLLNDRCELGPGLDCELEEFSLSQDNKDLLFESTRALVDACVSPPPCTVELDESGSTCQLGRGDDASSSCAEDELGGSATLLVATGVPGVVLFADSAAYLFGPLDQLPTCDLANEETLACAETELGQLFLPGWPPLEGLLRLRIRSLALLQGTSQPVGEPPCERLRQRLRGVVHQCEGFAAEGRPVRPNEDRTPGEEESIGSSALVLGEVAWTDEQLAPDTSAWVEVLIVSELAAPVIALRREVVPEGAQPDGLVGGVLLRNTETILDFTEAIESPGVRVRCLDPGERCLAVPACSEDVDTVEFEDASAGRTSCCFGLPSDLIAAVVLEGADKEPPRVEDACCSALSRAALLDLQSPELGLCTGVDLP